MLIISISLILGGALGNITDSVFYGVIFDHSYGNIATLFSPNPYGTLLHGKVVDMFYFPIIDTVLPDWLPIWGGERFRFFEPVFNVADSAICIAVGLMIVFLKSKRAALVEQLFLFLSSYKMFLYIFPMIFLSINIKH